MNRKKLLIRVFLLIFSILIVNYLAEKFYWYSAVWYFDMIMHFSGGLWVGLTAIWLLFGQKSYLDLSFILKILSSVLLIGICWELFEIIFYNYIAQNPFNILDTVSDLFFDLVGGLFAILYFGKRIMLKTGDKI
ncbi:MAG: hypothetical protein AAB687_01505 [Patescibacteria group bacterium]